MYSCESTVFYYNLAKLCIRSSAIWPNGIVGTMLLI
jgi:hypothetical protein